MDDLERFVELVRRELGCADARLEVGGHEAAGPTRLIAQLAQGWRLAAIFDVPPSDPGTLQAKLESLAESFAGIPARLHEQMPIGKDLNLASEEVDYALAVLADKTKALRALVLDEDSPVMWGSSELPRGREDIEVALWTGELIESVIKADLDPVQLVGLDDQSLHDHLARVPSAKLRDRLLRRLPTIRELGVQRDRAGWADHFLVCRAIAAIRRAPERNHALEDGLAWLTREFGGIYHVVLVFSGEFSELTAKGVLMRALPAIEKLVLSLPPIEPTPRGARVIQLVPR